MTDPSHRLLIAPRRPAGLKAATQFGRLIKRMDGLTVAYRIPIGSGSALAGWGCLRVEATGEEIWCRLAGEVFRPNPYEFAFHSGWLTRRGLIMAVRNLNEKRPPTARPPTDAFIQPVGLIEREFRAEAERWFGFIKG